jgi:putative hydrolase of the HAD superfamily
VIRAVLFDLDGTLFDHASAAGAGLLEHLAEVLPELEPVEHDTHLARWRELEQVHFDEYLAGKLTLQGQRRTRVRGLLGSPEMSDADADAWFAGYWGRYRERWTAFADVAPMLAALAGLDPAPRIGIVTNGMAEFQHAKLALLGLSEHFEVMIAADEEESAKPDPAIFLTACDRLGVAPGEAAYVGDLLDVDALGAARAGMLGIWLCRDGSAASANGVPTIAGLHELLDVLAA